MHCFCWQLLFIQVPSLQGLSCLSALWSTSDLQGWEPVGVHVVVMLAKWALHAWRGDEGFGSCSARGLVGINCAERVLVRDFFARRVPMRWVDVCRSRVSVQGGAGRGELVETVGVGSIWQ